MCPSKSGREWRVCQHCGKLFRGLSKYNRRQKYCSPNCCTLAWLIRRRNAAQPKWGCEGVCRRCGKPLHGRRRTYCSDRCWRQQKDVANNLRKQDSYIGREDIQIVRDELILYACQEHGARLRGRRGPAHDDFRLGYENGFPLNGAQEHPAFDNGKPVGAGEECERATA